MLSLAVPEDHTSSGSLHPAVETRSRPTGSPSTPTGNATPACLQLLPGHAPHLPVDRPPTASTNRK